MDLAKIYPGMLLHICTTGEEGMVISTYAVDNGYGGTVSLRVPKQTRDGINHVEEVLYPFEVETLEENLQRTIDEMRLRTRIAKAAQEQDVMTLAPTALKPTIQ